MAQRIRKGGGFTIDPDLEARLRQYVDERAGRVKISDVVAAGLVIFFHDLDDAERVASIDRARNYDLEMKAKRNEAPRLKEATRQRIRKQLAPKKQGHPSKDEAIAS